MNQSKIRDPRMWGKWKASGAVRQIGALKVDSHKMSAILSEELADDIINEAVGNWTGRHFKAPDPRVKSVLVAYAKEVVKKIFAGATPYPDFSPTWKEDISNRVYEVLGYKQFKEMQIPVIANALSPVFSRDVRDDLENGLWGYSLSEIANYVGCVAYMVKNNLDPELLHMSPEEAHADLLKFADRIKKSNPDQLIIIDPETDSPQDVVNEVVLRVNPPDISSCLPK